LCYKHGAMPEPDVHVLLQQLRDEVKALREEMAGKVADQPMNTREAAKYLGISQRALRALVYRRQIAFSKAGNRLRFRRADLAPKR
jgi:excisionase family DNA binding protein